MDFNEIKNLDNNYVANTYSRFDVAIKTGEGSTLEDFNGKKYIDFSSGIAVNILGINYKPWQDAVINQVLNIPHTSNLYYSYPQTALAEKLCNKTGMKKVFFGNSGAEANEGAIKVARKYSHDKYNQDRSEIITLVNSFHGRTIATLSATGQDHFHENFGPFVSDFAYAKANDLEDVKKHINDKTCAIMVETIQGEGGVLVLDDSFVKGIYELCQKHDLVFIVDEVQTGNGRTGFFYSYMAYDVKPDVVTTAKGIGGGLPLGCILLGEKVENVLGFGDHGSTFGGNPVVTAGANAIVDAIDDALLNDVKRKSALIVDYVKNMENVLSISGKGFMLGIETTKNAKEVVKECIQKGLIVLTAKSKVRLLPPLNITDSELMAGLAILKEVIEK